MTTWMACRGVAAQPAQSDAAGVQYRSGRPAHAHDKVPGQFDDCKDDAKGWYVDLPDSGERVNIDMRPTQPWSSPATCLHLMCAWQAAMAGSIT
jgi:hypothetical protein